MISSNILLFLRPSPPSRPSSIRNFIRTISRSAILRQEAAAPLVTTPEGTQGLPIRRRDFEQQRQHQKKPQSQQAPQKEPKLKPKSKSRPGQSQPPQEQISQPQLQSEPAPQSQPEPQILNYHISRTPSKNLGIYEATKNGGTRKLTTLKGITGDITALQRDLVRVLALPEERVKINQLTKHIIFQGLMKAKVSKFLEERQF